MEKQQHLGSPDATLVALRSLSGLSVPASVANPKRTVYSNLLCLGADARALGLTLERAQADANCKEQWECDAVADGYWMPDVARKIEILAPIAKRDPDAAKRAEANAMLRECYAKMAAFQKAGVATPTIDMGAL